MKGLYRIAIVAGCVLVSLSNAAALMTDSNLFAALNLN